MTLREFFTWIVENDVVVVRDDDTVHEIKIALGPHGLWTIFYYDAAGVMVDAMQPVLPDEHEPIEIEPPLTTDEASRIGDALIEWSTSDLISLYVDTIRGDCGSTLEAIRESWREDLRDEPVIFGIRAHRSSASVLGAAEAWLKRDGEVVEFDDRDDAQGEVDRLNERTGSANVHYTVARRDEED